MIKEQAYFKHNKTGKAILLKQLGKPGGVLKAIVKVVKTNETKTVNFSTIAKSYHEITWQEALK